MRDRPPRPRREGALIGLRAVAVQAGMGRRRAARQRHRDAVAGEAGDHRRLVADPEQAGRGRARAPAIRHAGDRLPCAGHRAADPLGEQGRLLHQRREQGLAPVRHPRLRDRQAEIGRAVLLHAAARHSRRRRGGARSSPPGPRGARRRAARRPTESGRSPISRAAPRSSCLPVARNKRVGGHLARRRRAGRTPPSTARAARPRSTAAPASSAMSSRVASSRRRDRPGGGARQRRLDDLAARRPAAAGGSAARRARPDRARAASAPRSRPSRGSRRRRGRARRGCARSAPASRRPAPARSPPTPPPARRRRSAQPFDAQPEGEAADDPRAPRARPLGRGSRAIRRAGRSGRSRAARPRARSGARRAAGRARESRDRRKRCRWRSLISQPPRRARLHEAEEGVELVVGHMMGDQAGDDEVDRPGDVAIVAGAIFDRPVRSASPPAPRPRCCGLRSTPIRSTAMSRRRAQRAIRRSMSPWPKPTSSRRKAGMPLVPRARGSRASAAPPSVQRIDPARDRSAPGRKSPASSAGIVHLLVAADARRRARSCRPARNGSPRRRGPGPKAMATPLPVSGRPISSASTNIRVDDDMLP